MKTCIVFAAFTAAVFAQAPQIVTPETVIAQVDGKGITAAEVRQFLDTNPDPALMNLARTNPADLLSAMSLTSFLTQEADKHHLSEQSPWKEQIEAKRSQIMIVAIATYIHNEDKVSDEERIAYYEAHKANYQQLHVRAIKIGFKPSLAAVSPADIKRAAQLALEAAHAENDRSETDAQKLAGEIVKKARGGEDFTKLVAQYSEDSETKSNGGDFGNISRSSSMPDAIKQAVLVLDTGNVSDPIRISTSLYIFKVEEKTIQPINSVHQEIMEAIKQDHFNTYMSGLRQRFKATITRPEFFLQLNAPKK